MTQPITLRSLVPTPGAGFEQPFEMLEACHERVHRMLTLLGRLREHVRGHGADVQAQQAARDVMRYFDIAAPHHHQDEELHVFPPLLAQGDERVVQVVRRLQADHVQMESRWAAARAVLQRVSEGAVQQFSAPEDAALAAFAGIYDDHIQAEEQIVYPAARATMDQETVAKVGEEMMRRRGVK
jgi:hemerythrin-like domain-containing protein